MKISIVIPAFNEQRLLGATLAAVKAASVAFQQREWDCEMIVCDNNSTDRTPEIAHEHGAGVVFEPINQIAGARNRGASVATGDWLIFVDADSEPSAALFSDVAEAISSGHVLAGGAVIRMITPRKFAAAFNSLWNWLSCWKRWMAGSFIFVEARAFREVGGFSGELYAGEEIDLSMRLKQLAKGRGKRLVILRRHPLVTSGRKVELYSSWELLKFFGRAAISGKRVLKQRECCHPWYDGRR